MSKSDDERIYESPEWAKRRSHCKWRRDWYLGEQLDEKLDEKDRKTGEYLRMFPLALNLIELGVDLHTDLAKGNLEHDERLVVSTKITRGDKPEEAKLLEQVINQGVWIPSNGGPIQREALLWGNVYGGTAFQLSWEPWNDDLPYRLAVRHIQDPSEIYVVAEHRDKWRPLEVYIGYKISPKVAKAKYGITPDDENKEVLYLEYWTREKWRITVDGKVPVMKWADGEEFELQGDNPWGFIPIYFVPHDRKGDFYGKGHVEGTEYIVKEINARTANICDLVHALRPGQLWATDISLSPSNVKIPDGKGGTKAEVTYLGSTRTAPNAQPPRVFPTPAENLPSSLIEYPATLLDYWMMVARVSPASFGLDDTQSGRITGTAVANRMWSSVAHAKTERLYMAETLCIMAIDIIRILQEREGEGEFERLGIDPPKLGGIPRYFEVQQEWSTMLLMDKAEEHEMLIERLKEGGISLESYLKEHDVRDVDGEMGLIYARAKFYAELEALVAQMQMEARANAGSQAQGSKGRKSSTS